MSAVEEGDLMRRLLPAILVMALGSISVPLVASAAPPLERVIVVLEQGAGDPAAIAQEVGRDHGGTVGFVYREALSGFSLAIPPAAIAALESRPGVAYVEPDLEVFTTGTQPIPTGIDRIEADLNPAGAALTNVDVAIIDTGVYIKHPDLNLTYVTDCTSAIFYPLFGGCSADGNHQDENGHGTHVAGIAAAYDNDIGTIGTAPGAVLWSLKALNADGSGYLGSILAAIDLVAAYSSSIEVANMSFGFEGSAQSLDDALTNATARGVVFVAAAGNSASDATTFSPANHPDVIAVSALADFDGLPGGVGSPSCRQDGDDTLADFSNFGAPVDLAAPGVCIYSTWLDNGYATLSGTSMAAPFVTGAVARLIAQGYPKPTNQSQVHALRDLLIDAGITQASECGFSGDPDSFPEPLLFLNSSLYGGDGSCEGAGSPPPPADISMAAAVTSVTQAGRNWTAVVTVTDANAALVQGATVEGVWSYLDRRNRSRTVLESGVTGTDGAVTFTETFPRNSTVVSFCVSNVSKAGYIYVGGETCGSP